MQRCILSKNTAKTGWYALLYYVLPCYIYFILFIVYTWFTVELLAIIFALPFLGIGLKFKTFNDSSLEENGEIVYDAGYEPNYYWPVLPICCYLGYTQGLYETSIINMAGLLISTTACFIWLTFPDKINKYLPFENRSKKGEILYLAIALIIFFILLYQFTTIPFTELTGITN